MLVTLAEKIVDGFFAFIPRVKPLTNAASQALLVAHRGAHDNAQGIFENTLEAFQLAKDMGCWGIEFDVHTTADGVFVVNHDPDLARLWGHDLAIADLSFSQLRALAPKIPTLAEVVTQYGTIMHLFIELKVPVRNEQALIKVLSHCQPIKDYHLLTLQAAFFSSLIYCPKHALLLVAIHNNVNEFCNLSIKEQYGGVLGNYLLITKKQRNKLMAKEQNTGVGFVNSKNSLYRELNRGIHLIFTNRAKQVSHYLKQLRAC